MRDRLLLILLGLIVASVLISPFQRELFVGDETKYSRVIHEMRESGSLLVMRLNGEPYTHKPPLHFWTILALTYVFGYQSLWPFVLQSVLGYVGIIWVTGKLARELFGEGAMWPARLAAATSILLWGIAQTARMDATFVLFISIAALYVLRFMKSGATRPLFIAAGAIAIAILIKGPMAFVMIALLMIFERFRTKRLPGGVGRYLAAFGIVLAGPMLWLIPSIMQGGSEYANELLIKQNVGRAVNAWVHKEPFWYYIAHAPADFFPWFFLAVIAVIAVYKRKATERDGVGFCLSWAASVVVPFSLLSSKLDVYMLPVCVPVSLIVGWYLSSAVEDRYTAWGVRANRIVLAAMTFLSALVALVPLLVPRFCGSGIAALRKAASEVGTCQGSGFVPGPELAQAGSMVPAVFGAAALIALVAFIVSLRGTGLPALRRSSLALVVGGLAPLLLLAAFLMEAMNEMSSTRPLVRALVGTGAPAERIGLYYSPHLWTRNMPESMHNVVYAGREILTNPAPSPPRIIAVRRDRARDLGPNLPQQYRVVTQLRMIGKDFDVYERR